MLTVVPVRLPAVNVLTALLFKLAEAKLPSVTIVVDPVVVKYGVADVPADWVKATPLADSVFNDPFTLMKSSVVDLVEMVSVDFAVVPSMTMPTASTPVVGPPVGKRTLPMNVAALIPETFTVTLLPAASI